MAHGLVAPSRLTRLEGLDRSVPVWVLTAAALGLLILLPLGWLGYMSVSGERGVTLAHYARVFTDPQLQKALWNTVVLAFWSGLAAVAIGAPMAWLSARSSSDGGIVRPSALAVLRLITSSNFVGCWTGKSAGFAPLRIFPA